MDVISIFGNINVWIFLIVFVFVVIYMYVFWWGNNCFYKKILLFKIFGLDKIV